jgi:hypothetical protein
MSIQINPQEIYLLERYISLEYFAEMRDSWEKMVKHVESCLQVYLSNLPPNYRSMPLPQQADIVWGHRVLPNFRDTLQGLYTGFIMLSHGDVSALNYAHGPVNDAIAQRRDYSPDWMSTEDQDLYDNLITEAKTMAACITATEGAYWRPKTLSNYSGKLGELNPPAQWPAYRINQKISVQTGTKTPQSGIYVPDLTNSCAQFLSTNYEESPQAYVIVGFRDLLDPQTGEKYGEEALLEKKDCTWYLVERAADADEVQPSAAIESAQTVRVAAGLACPESGFYFTPARAGSRRLFQRGDVMPDFGADYGTTIWQWDGDQRA